MVPVLVVTKFRVGGHVTYGMLSIWKLRVGVESYYLAEVASGLDEYYSGAGEAVGRWTGTGSRLLDLDGDVAVMIFVPSWQVSHRAPG
jgi:hypothetical protein